MAEEAMTTTVDTHPPDEVRLIERPKLVRKRVALTSIEPWSVAGGRQVVERSMAALGGDLSEPVLQKLIGSTYAYRVIDGARRLSARQAAGDTSVWAKIMPADYDGSVVTVAMNLSRAPNAAREAIALGDMIEKGWDEKEIGQLLGLPVTLIRRRLKLLDLPEELFKGVMDGHIKTSIAHSLSALRDDLKAELVRVYQQNGKLTGQDVRDANRALRRSTVGRLAAQGLFQDTGTPIDTIEPKRHEWLSTHLRSAREIGVTKDELNDLIDRIWDEPR